MQLLGFHCLTLFSAPEELAVRAPGCCNLGVNPPHGGVLRGFGKVLGVVELGTRGEHKCGGSSKEFRIALVLARSLYAFTT